VVAGAGAMNCIVAEVATAARRVAFVCFPLKATAPRANAPACVRQRAGSHEVSMRSAAIAKCRTASLFCGLSWVI